MNEYKTSIGLEIHAELLTKTKLFCACENVFEKEKNTHVCPVCLGHPGTLPVLNKEAVALAVKAGIICACKINEESIFERKNYFYPDLPKAYQITQLRKPICENGEVLINGKKIRINRIQLEEDAGKLIHFENGSIIDYNRAGVPLIEIVTEPDFTSSDEVLEFLEWLILDLKYANVCDAKLEQGSLRVDVNISLAKKGERTLGNRREIKNLNSLRSVKRAIEYEEKYQKDILASGGEMVCETVRFSEEDGKTYPMRKKEKQKDYRFFDEPDIPKIIIHPEEIEKIKKSIPILAKKRMNKYIKEYGIKEDDARLIVLKKEFSDFFEDAVFISKNYKEVANLMLTTLNRMFNETKKEIADVAFSPRQLADLSCLLKEGKLSNNSAKEILSIMFSSSEEPLKIAEENDMLIENNDDELIKFLDELYEEKTELFLGCARGEKKIFGFLMGEFMKKAGKKTNPVIAKKLLEEKIKTAE